MLRRLLHVVLDHEAVRLREDVRELQDRLNDARKNTGTIVREQNEFINEEREARARATRELASWRDAAKRLAAEIGVVDAGQYAYPGHLIDAAVQHMEKRRNVGDRFTAWLRGSIAERTHPARTEALKEALGVLEDMIAGKL